VTAAKRAAAPRRLEEAWAARVRANREQAERLREIPVGDFYAPVSALFVADPRRTGEPALEVLQAMAGPDETWLDIGAGAGRYALPLALAVKGVIAVEPSAGMRQALRTGLAEHGISNVRIVPAVWPDALEQLGPLPVADVALIAHVGYDIEDIGPFLDGMEAATSDRCIAVLTDRSPASVADPFSPGAWRGTRGAAGLAQRWRSSTPRPPDRVVRVERAPPDLRLRARPHGVPASPAVHRRGGDKDLHFRAVPAGPHRGARRGLDARGSAGGLDRHRHLVAAAG
jgi:hypothetical protein